MGAFQVRVLNDEGIQRFIEYLASLRIDPALAAPVHLLEDGLTSDPFEPSVILQEREFTDAYERGVYLCEALKDLEDRKISRNHRLWTSLALYYFEQICRRGPNAEKRPLENAVYVLEPRFSFRRYYRHVIRTPWLSVKEHGEFSKVLLYTARGGTRTDIAEQLGAYQDLFANKRLIETAFFMYFDTIKQKLRRGAGSKGPGSPRRLASVARQLELTYDLQECPREYMMELLPPEFKHWARP